MDSPTTWGSSQSHFTFVSLGSSVKPSMYRINEDWCCWLLVFNRENPTQKAIKQITVVKVYKNILPTIERENNA